MYGHKKCNLYHYTKLCWPLLQYLLYQYQVPSGGWMLVLPCCWWCEVTRIWNIHQTFCNTEAGNVWECLFTYSIATGKLMTVTNHQTGKWLSSNVLNFCCLSDLTLFTMLTHAYGTLDVHFIWNFYLPECLLMKLNIWINLVAPAIGPILELDLQTIICIVATSMDYLQWLDHLGRPGTPLPLQIKHKGDGPGCHKSKVNQIKCAFRFAWH